MLLLTFLVPVVLVLVALLIGTAIWGSSKKGSIQAQQDAEWRARREARRRDRAARREQR